MGHSQLLSDFARVARIAALVKVRRSSADHFEVCDFREIGENFILHTGSEVSVFFVVAQIFKRQNRD